MKKENKIIALIEDNVFLSNLLKVKLENEGFKVIQVFEGNKVSKEFLKENEVDLVLLDLILPDRNGFEILKEIKSDPVASKIPVIVLSNLGQEEDIAKGKKLGADDYFVKVKEPIELIIKKIKGFLKVEK